MDPLPEDLAQFRAFLQRLILIYDTLGFQRYPWVYDACLRLQVIWGEAWDDGEQGRRDAAEKRKEEARNHSAT